MPILATAIAVGTKALPKLFKGGLKLFKGIGKKVKGIGKGIGKKIGKFFKNRRDRKNGVTDIVSEPTTENIQPETINTMENEQDYDTGTDTQKGFMGLQSVESGKKQQTKIMMIAAAIILLLFFFMKKK